MKTVEHDNIPLMSKDFEKDRERLEEIGLIGIDIAHEVKVIDDDPKTRGTSLHPTEMEQTIKEVGYMLDKMQSIYKKLE